MAFYTQTAAEKAFQESPPIFHLYTKPLETDSLFYSEKERIIPQNYIAIATCEAGCTLLAFSIMTNHFHFILMGEYMQVVGFYDRFLEKEPNHPLVALCYDFQLYDHLEVEAHDIPVETVITDK